MRGLRTLALALALALTFVIASPASAQAPEDVIAVVCDTVGNVDGDLRGAVPLCPVAPDPAPAPAAEPATQSAPAPEDPAVAEDPVAVAGDAVVVVRESAEEIVDDPFRTPEVLVRIVAWLRARVDAMLGLPGALVESVADAVDGALDAARVKADAVREAADRGTDSARGAVAAVADAGRRASEAAGQLAESASRSLQQLLSGARQHAPERSLSTPHVRAAPSADAGGLLQSLSEGLRL